MAEKQLESHRSRRRVSEGLVRSTARGRLRKAEALRHRAGGHAARTVPCDGRSGGEQSVVGRHGRGQAAGALLSGQPQRHGLSRWPVPLLQPVAGIHHRRRFRAGAVGRPAQTRLAFGPAYLRLHPARFRNLGREIRQPVRSAGRSGRLRTSATLVGAEPLPLERTLRKPPARFHGRPVSFARSRTLERITGTRSIWSACAP